MNYQISKKLKFLVIATQIFIGIGLTTAETAFAATSKVYVADEESNTVSVLDANSFKKIGNVAVGLGPHNVQVAPDGKTVWVTNNGEPGAAAAKMPSASTNEHSAMAGAGAVWTIDSLTDTVTAKIPVGKNPAHVILTTDGLFAYVANGGDNSVSVVSTSTREVVATIPVGASPHGMRFSPNGNEAWVANLNGGTVSVIDTASRKQVAQIAVGNGPAQVGFTPDGRLDLCHCRKTIKWRSLILRAAR